MTAETARPWGRFTLVSKDPAEDSDHIYFTNKHCVVRVDGTDDAGHPIVQLQDNSRNGIWVNADRLGKGASIQLGSGFTVHFTKPGTTPAGVTPMAYKFEFLNTDHDSFVSVLAEHEGNEVQTTVDRTVGADESVEATQLTSPAAFSSPLGRKRKRMDEDCADVTVATCDDDSELETARKQPKVVESKLKTTEAQVGLKEGLEQTVQTQVDRLTNEKLDLMVKLKASTAENFQLKTDLVAKDKEVEAKIKEATTKSLEAAAETTVQLQEDAVRKEKAMELKIKQSLTKTFEAVFETKSQDMAIKLEQATKKYQQKIEAEHYEERKAMSEKMAALANESEKLHTALSMKDEQLAECSDKIASLRDEITALEKKVAILSAKEEKVAAFEEKIAELEKKLSVSKDESAEMLGLLAAAEEKTVAAEDTVAKANIAASAAADINVSYRSDVSKQHELQKSISSLREELEMYRTKLARREKKDREATTSVATAATTSIAAQSIRHGEDADALRARLAAALSLFRQVQALGIQGERLTTMTTSSELHLLPPASAELECSSTVVSKSPLSSAEDGQHNEEGDATPAPSTKKSATKSAIKAAKDCTDEAKVERRVRSSSEAASSEPSPSKLKRENKSTKQASTAIETDAASVLAGMTSIEDNGTHSPTPAANGSDWEMVE